MDKVLPQNSELEQLVIGGLLGGLTSAKLVLVRMDPVWFYFEKHRVIMGVLRAHIENGETPDLPLTCQWLTTAGVLGEVGGQAYLEKCFDPAMVWQLEGYISELRKLYLDRQIVAAVYDVECNPSPENIEALRERSRDRDSASLSGIINVKDCAPEIMELLEPRTKGLYEMFDMPKMDQYHNSMSPGNVLTIAARPGVGKTVMATHIAIKFCEKYKEPVLYFSTEMPHEETLMRVLSPMSKVPGWKFRKRFYSKDGADQSAITTAAGRLVDMPFYMVDKPAPTLADVRAAMLATKCKLVIVDYIQRMNLEIGREGRPAAIGQVMMGFKNSCRDCGCLGVVLSQMDRETDHLTGRARPQLADLKGSGDIEQESDAVLLMWRHNKKDKDTKKGEVPEIELLRPIEAIWAKNRHGSSDVSVQLVFDEKFIAFLEWTDEEAMRWADKIIKSAPKEKTNGSQWGNGNTDADGEADGVPS